MSIFRLPTLDSIATKFESLWERVGRPARHDSKHGKCRSLLVDPLEERQLLSVSPADWTDVLVNQVVSENQQQMVAGQSLAMDNDGDFVVVWTRFDEVIDPDSGQPVIDPVTGRPWTDANIYARYFTDEVQRLTIPTELTADAVAGQFGYFTLKYGGNEVQKLTISATYQPQQGSYYGQSSVSGSITLGFDVNGNGVIGPGESTTVVYSEVDSLATTASSIQTALQGLGGALADVNVSPISPKEFEIHFGDFSLGNNQPLISVQSTNFASGFLPAVQIETIREPVEIGRVYVSPTDPNLTARSIEENFRQTMTGFDIGPIEFEPPSRIPPFQGPYSQPQTIRQGVPNVSVQPVTLPDGTVSLTQFDITFDGKISGSTEGNAGKKDHPELVVVKAVDELGASWIASPEINVVTLKEPSPEFRVNPEEPEDVFTPNPDKFDQTNAVVAMDADGDFVIAWQSEIGESQASGNVSDIYARRFTPIGLTAPAHVAYVPGIMAKGDAFRVNTKTTGPQVDPSIGMDDDGNFTIGWSSTSQDISFFNSVRARQFTRDGAPIADEFLVNTEDTQIHSDPYVGMSHDGNTVITWNTGLTITAKIYDSKGNLIDGPFNVGSGVNHSTAFDKQNRFIVAYETGTLQDPDNVGRNSIGTRAIMYQLFDAAGNVSRTVVRDTFRPNSASFDLAANTLWPGTQQNPRAGLDADGDLVIAYDGFGPDVSDSFYLGSSYFAKALSDPANADLLVFFPGGNVSLSSNIDVDTAIELVLINAANQGATLSQLGRIRAILDSKATLLRGEANGVMYSRFDADPPTGAANILASDSVVNAKRDGHNTKYLIAIDTAATGGTFAARLYNSFAAGFDTITFNPVFANNVMNVAATRDDIHDKLEAATRTGVNWPEPQYDGVVDVRVVSTQEILARQVTLSDGSQPWRYPTAANTVVFEVTFQGEVHDSYIGLELSANGLTPAPQTAQIIQYQAADSGTTQTDVSLAVETDGDFTLVWMQHEERTWDASGYPDSYYGSANQNIYYRRFDDSVDAAGPRMTDLVDHQGNLVADGGTIEGPVRYIVVPFDEPLLAGDPAKNPDSVLNTNNWVLTQNGVEIPFGVVDVQFGLNKASELAGRPDAFGGTYELSAIPTNKWEAVLTLDANGGLVPGMTSLGSAEYKITALSPSAAGGISGLRDLASNPLGSLGPAASGVPMGRTFAVHIDEVDTPVDSVVSGGAGRITGTLYPESPNAVAVDADGDYAMVWTAYDTALGRDRLFMRCYDADGTPADLPLLDGDNNVIGTRVDAFPIMAVTPTSTHPELLGSVQRFGSVAIDPDGDFVVTWTNYTGGDADVYARAFPSRAGILGLTDVGGFEVPVFSEDVTEAFRVNGSTASTQKWSDVAMDTEGNFVIAWTHDARTVGSATTNYEVYARRYDAGGANPGRQIQVNVNTTGNQQMPSVAMAGNGDFVIAWQSNESGVDDDIYAREFNASGSPKAGQTRVNDITVGHQRYPDVAMRFDGQAYVVTWTDSAADTSGNSVWAKISGQQPRHYSDPSSHIISQTHQFSINVPDSFTIADLNLQLGILTHTRLEDVTVSLQSPSGTTVVLFSALPKRLVDGSRPAGNTLDHTIFDDQAPTGVSINNSDRGAVPNYEGSFIPQQALAAFNGEDAQGTWTLIVQDVNPGNNETGSLSALSPEIGSWSLDITDVNAVPTSFQINSTNEGDQMYSSVAMDTLGNFVITWSGKGTQPSQSDTSGYGVFYQRYNGGGTRMGGETRVNRQTDGNQWISSIGMDARGNFVVGWTGVGTLPGTTAVYKYDSASNFQRPDIVGPIITDVLALGERLPDGDTVVVDPDLGLASLTVVFDEALSTVGGATGLHSVLNPNNWAIARNNSVIVGGIKSVTFGLNPLTNKYEATVTFDGNGINFGTAPLKDGAYVLTVRDLITDGSALLNPATGAVISTGNALDGDYDGIPGASPTTLGLGGYEHRFTIESDTTGPGPDPGKDPNDPDSDRPVTGDDDTFPDTGARLAGENRGAVASDADGHHVVVLTAIDNGKDRVYFRRFNPDGSPSDNLGPIPVLQGATNAAQFAKDDQRYATVAADADGDFIVTWTNIRTVTDAQGNPVIDPVTGMPKVDADIYARRFNAKGTALGNPFIVNSYTADNQIWSSVAMDADGDFVITWSSYAQETGGQPGSGYGVYARRFDSAGQPMAPEFQVNVTTSRNQQYSVVDMSSQGSFVIAWQSDQGGSLGDDIMARVFNADGSPLSTLSRSEIIVNDTRTGSQRYPDVSMTPDGNNFVCTWTASGSQDGSGNGVYGQLINVPLLQQQVAGNPIETYSSATTPVPFGYGNTITSTITIPSNYPDSFTINDINVFLNIQHAQPDDVQVYLIAPSGTQIALFANVPRSGAAGADFIDTLFDDEAPISINDPTATPPFISPTGYRPQDPLSRFNGQLTSGGTDIYGNVLPGVWTLVVQDVDENFDPTARFQTPINGVFNGWSMDIERVPERSGEFLVNSTTLADQMLSTVDFSNQGDFVVAWQGNGSVPENVDASGIFFQRFDFTLDRIGGETRANNLTTGDQVFPSVSSTNDGNFVIAWQGPGTTAGTTEVYRYMSQGAIAIEDVDGPWVTDVLTKDGSPVFNGAVLPIPSNNGGVTELQVLFSEDLSVRDGAAGLDSVLNPNNWVLQRNGATLQGAITSIDFGFSSALNKYQATLHLDGNPLAGGAQGLPVGDYVLVARDEINDNYQYDAVDNEGEYFVGNALDGDFDGAPGTRASVTGYSGYMLRFSVSGTAQLGPELRVNEVPATGPDYVQVFGPSLGTGLAREESTQSVAVDHDGDFAVAWTSYGQDDPNDPTSGGVYLRLYDRASKPLTGEILVNQTIAGTQNNAAIAMDADGDLIVVWQSEGTSDDGSWDVYARRFNSVGTALSDEFRVNEETANNQLNPAVATDYYGNFVVIWASESGTLGNYFNEIRGRLYDLKGEAATTDFVINDTPLPAQTPQPGLTSTNPAVAMAPNGTFAVAWDQITAQTSGVVTDSQIMAKYFYNDGTEIAPEFVADSGVGTGGGDIYRTARNPQLDLDENGNMTVVWESFGPDDNGPDSYGIFFQQFELLITPDEDDPTLPPEVTITEGAADQVNLFDFVGQQVNPGVGVDANGNFTVVWNGAGGENDPLDPTNTALFTNTDSEGVFRRSYDPTAVPTSIQTTVNMTHEGIQHYPSISMQPNGSFVVAWNGQGVGDRHGIFVRRYTVAGDTAGPWATELRSTDGGLIAEGDNLFNNPKKLVVVFGEQMSTTGGATGFNSVLNPANWALVNGLGAELVGAISKVDFALNPATNKWEATLTFNPAVYPNGLANGYYQLVARSQLKDLAGNALESSGLRPSGTGLTFLPPTSPTGGAIFTFRVHELTPGDPNPGDLDPILNTNLIGDKFDPAVARNASGRYVAVWVERADVDIPDPDDPQATITVTQSDIYARMFDANDQPIRNRYGNNGAFLVNSLTTGEQLEPDVVIDDAGNFLVVWSGSGTSALGTVDEDGIFGQRFNALGDPIGGQFAINTTSKDVQEQPAVAMDSAGNFVVAWRSYDQGGIIARLFSSSGAASAEFRVNTTLGTHVRTPDVAMDADGDFTIVWTAAEQDNGSMGVFAQRYNKSGARLGGEFRVNQYQTSEQESPRIAMDDLGNSVIVWQSFGQDGSGYGIYGRRYNASGAAQGNEFRVNTYTPDWQFEPAVAMASNGDFVVTWSGWGNEGDRGEFYGIFAKMYNADGSPFIVPGQTEPVGEFRINAVVANDQRRSDVAMDAAGHYVVVWEGTTEVLLPDPEDTETTILVPQTDIYARFVDPPVTASDDGKELKLLGTSGADTFEFIGGATPKDWVIKVNGKTYTAASTVEKILFEGMGGNDTVSIIGTAANESVSMWPGKVLFEGVGYTVEATSVEIVTVDGKGGYDKVVEMNGSAGNDSFVIRVGQATATGTGYSQTAIGFEEVYAYARGGTDEVLMYDTAGKDIFKADGSGGWASMQGDGYFHRAKGFHYAHGYSTSSTDEAYLYDSAGDDDFKAYFDDTKDVRFSKMSGSGYYHRAKNFPTVYAVANRGGEDRARLLASQNHVEEFVGTPSESKLSSAQANYSITAQLFETVLARSTRGDQDKAVFFDEPNTTNKQVFKGLHEKGELFGKSASGRDFQVTARKFATVEATATPGTGHIARLIDTAGDDHLVIDEVSARMYKYGNVPVGGTAADRSLDLLYQAMAFDRIEVYRQPDQSGVDTRRVSAVDIVLTYDDPAGWNDI